MYRQNEKNENMATNGGISESYKQSQEYKIYCWFLNHTGTMLQCSRSLGIERANICRRVADLKDKGLLKFCYVDIDYITGQKAGHFRAIERK